jgi:hypothetical protein
MSGLDDIYNSTELPINCSSPFDDRIYAIVAAVGAVSGFISFLASCFVVFIIVLFKKWRFFTQRLILYLAITSVLLALAAILQRTDYNNAASIHQNNFCIFAGFFSQVSGWMALDAMTCIVISLLLTAFTRKRAEKLEILYVFLIFIFPLMFNWIPFINSSYGRAGAWCWIRSTEETTCLEFKFGQLLQQLLWYIPLYVIMFALIILYVIVMVKLYHTKRKWTGTIDQHEKKTQEKWIKEMLSLVAYPLMFFLIVIPAFINRIHGAVHPGNPEPVLWFIAAVFFPLQGGAVALVFSLDPETRKRLTLANFKTAFRNFCKSTEVKEYKIPGNKELEKSFVKERDSSMNAMEYPGEYMTGEYRQYVQEKEPLELDQRYP